MTQHFAYDARTPDGVEIQGTIAAETLAQAIFELTSQQLVIIGIRLVLEVPSDPQKPATSFAPIVAERVALIAIVESILNDVPYRSQRRDLQGLLRWLSTLTASTSPTTAPLQVSRWLPALHAMARHAADHQHAMMVKVLTDELDDDCAPHKSVVGALIYPAVIGVMALIVGWLVYTSAVLPMSADAQRHSVLNDTFRPLTSAVLLLLPAAALLTFFAAIYVGQRWASSSGAWIAERLPLLKTAVRAHAWSQLARRAAHLLAARTDHVVALRIASDACEFDMVRQHARQLAAVLSMGSVTVAPQLGRYVPHSIVALLGLQVPREARIDGLHATATTYRERAWARTALLRSVVQVAGLLCIGSIVVLLLASIVSMILRLTSFN